LDKSSSGDWVKALAVIILGPLFVIYLGISAVNQMLRARYGFVPKLVPTKEQRKQLLTTMANSQLRILAKWGWTSVNIKVIYIGLFGLIVNVGVGKLTSIFLSWLNSWIEAKGFELPMVTLVFVMVGLVMFLLPPVPGVPVYLAGGVIIVKSAMQKFSFGLAVAYGIVVCWLIKMLAIVIQQKVIGERMSNNLTVKCLVGVNSLSTRAIRFILTSKGLDKRKVAILCGGPDWPTSVLTGIMRLRLLDMLVGSVPVVLLVAPCVCAGAFMLRCWTRTDAKCMDAHAHMHPNRPVFERGCFSNKTQ
jgi:hypothetical protein